MSITTFRWADARDITDMLRIERLSFEYPWVRSEFLRVLNDPLSCVMLAQFDAEIVGYMAFTTTGKKIILRNLAIVPEFRRYRFAWFMMRHLILSLNDKAKFPISAKLPETNLVGQLFMKALGFRCIMCEHRAYKENDQDAYHFVFTYDVPIEDDDCSGIQPRAHVRHRFEA